MSIALKHIEINIGKACNNKCRFCMSSKPESWDIKFYDREKLKEKLKNYALSGYKSVGFLGGDISIYPNMEEIFLYCKELGFVEIQAISNGMVFSSLVKAEKAVHSGLTRMNISIHSHDSQVEDYLTQIPGGLSRKLQAIDNFNALSQMKLLKHPISINIVLNKKNLDTIEHTVLFFFLKKHISDIRINFIWLDRGVREHWDELTISYTEFLPHLSKLVYLSLRYGFRLTFDTVPPCIFAQVQEKNKYSIIKKFLGEDQDHITEIDWTNGDTKFNWQVRKKNELKTQFPQCNSCQFMHSCQGVWKQYGEIYGGEEFIPIVDTHRENTELKG